MSNSEDRRLILHDILEAIPGVKSVKFQPPPSYKMEYPAIRYNYAQHQFFRADNINYAGFRRYDLIFITPDPTSNVPDILLQTFEMISLDRTYTSNNLNHYVFNLYY